jgi:hypothetical protein
MNVGWHHSLRFIAKPLKSRQSPLPKSQKNIYGIFINHIFTIHRLNLLQFKNIYWCCDFCDGKHCQTLPKHCQPPKNGHQKQKFYRHKKI